MDSEPANRDEVIAALQAKVANLEIALRANRRTGMAIGILMCEKKLTEDEAFNLLRVYSQHRYVKLVNVAETVILTGTLDVQ
jgi:AmiR/NasT family two-component response regulator